jgi:Flp pilus assembly protein TadG
MSRRRGGDRGAARSVEMVLVVPILLAMVMLILQSAVWWHARNLVEQAAAEGARAAAAFDGDCADATADATAYVASVGGQWVGTPAVTCTEGTTVRVVVEAEALSLLPPLNVTVRAAADVPEER